MNSFAAASPIPIDCFSTATATARVLSISSWRRRMSFARRSPVRALRTGWSGIGNGSTHTAAEFVATFLGGRRPGDSPDLYRRISPFYSPEKITTPLLLTVGDKDTRYADNLRFYEALRAAGANVTFIAFPGEAHELGRAAVEQYVQKALEFFRSASQGK